jgi:predicted glycosyltransferase
VTFGRALRSHPSHGGHAPNPLTLNGTMLNPATTSASGRAPRFLFCTNECVGLGHMRRTLTLARAVTEMDSSASALVITGAPLTPGLSLPAGVDTVKLPMLRRDAITGLGARNLQIESDDVHDLRASLALAAATAFAPDVAVIDKLPLGLGGELEPTLQALRASGTRIVLGLRDVEEDPVAVRRRWRETGAREALRRYYDAVLVYGPDGGTADALSCVGRTGLRADIHHVGYIGAPLPSDPPADLPREYLLATVGGGADGFPVLAAVVDAVRHRPLGLPVVVVAGPLMDPLEVQELRRRAEGLPVELFEARPDMDAVVAGARGVVAMAGYNTVAEITRAGHPAVLVPRVGPSAEQLIRARALADDGAFAMIHPDELTPARMADELAAMLVRARPSFEPAEHCGATVAAAILADMAERRAGNRRPALAIAG